MMRSLFNNYWGFISNRYFVRSVDFGENFEAFFVSAILAILGLRIWLKFINYLVVGSGNIHIAHILWGGFLMALAITIIITFLGKSSKKLAAVLGGLGFGTFIDELGKFITADNDYFYQPTFSIIYIIFVLLYLISRSIKQNQNFSKREYLANSVEYLEEAITSDLDVEEKEAAIKLLSKADQNNPITKALIKLCRELETIPKEKEDVLTRVKTNFSKFYFSLVSKKWFPKFINVFFISQFIINIYFIIISILNIVNLWDFSLSQTLNIFFNIIVGIFIAMGVIIMKKIDFLLTKGLKNPFLFQFFLCRYLLFITNS